MDPSPYPYERGLVSLLVHGGRRVDRRIPKDRRRSRCSRRHEDLLVQITRETGSAGHIGRDNCGVHSTVVSIEGAGFARWDTAEVLNLAVGHALPVGGCRRRRDGNGKRVAAADADAAGGRSAIAPASFLRCPLWEPRCSLHSAAPKSNGCVVGALIVVVNLEFGIGQLHLRNMDQGVLGCMSDSCQLSRSSLERDKVLAGGHSQISPLKYLSSACRTV